MSRSSAAPGGYIGGEPPRKPYLNQLSGVWKLDDVIERQKAGLWSNPLGIEDLFATHLYTGNGSTQTITNGIDLAGKGGLVWTKERVGPNSHLLYDTSRGAGKYLSTDTTGAEVTNATTLTSFNSTGFSLGVNASYNGNGTTYASWTFRKQAKFFDVVTYTGNGSNRTIAHNLGSVPGTIIVKRTDTTGDWQVYHRSLSNTEYLVLNNTAVKATDTTRWNSTTPTSTEFSLGTDATVNANTGTYVAYLFAHDAGGFGDNGNDSVISCGSFTAPGSGDATITLGYEPQWVIMKDATSASGWDVIDIMRGWNASTSDYILRANISMAEATYPYGAGAPIATGFTVPSTTYTAGSTIIYIAIRRGPMKAPTDATKVFKANAYTGNGTLLSITGVGFPPDFSFTTRRDSTSWVTTDKLRGASLSLYAQSTDAEVNNTTFEVRSYDQDGITYGQNSIVNGSSASLVNYLFRRAPGFFDVVAYTGTGSATTVSHNLGVAPELIIIKSRSNAYAWRISALFNSSTYVTGDLNNSTSFSTNVSYGSNYINSQPNAVSFAVTSNGSVNQSASTYVAYLFASCPGVSKVGSYTGTGTTLDIDCGFANGARFVLIKRTDASGHWLVWDTARGIVSGNDPYLLLSTPAAEDASTDWIDPLSSGFQISSTAPVSVNGNGGTYIYLAIA